MRKGRSELYATAPTHIGTPAGLERRGPAFARTASGVLRPGKRKGGNEILGLPSATHERDQVGHLLRIQLRLEIGRHQGKRQQRHLLDVLSWNGRLFPLLAAQYDGVGRLRMQHAAFDATTSAQQSRLRSPLRSTGWEGGCRPAASRRDGCGRSRDLARLPCRRHSSGDILRTRV